VDECKPLAEGTRAVAGADTIGFLASADYWDDVEAAGGAAAPRVPPESVIQVGRCGLTESNRVLIAPTVSALETGIS
jgi:hypothetical protein